MKGRWGRLAPVLLCGLGLAGCAAVLEGDGAVSAPVRNLERPSVAGLPPAETYLDRLDLWRREARVGLGGRVEAVLLEPGLAAAEVSHDAVVQGLGRAATEALLIHRWPILFGPQTDRFPVDVTWRFDEQFISSRRVLDPAAWTVRLTVSDGSSFEPLAVTVVQASPSPRDGFWVGKVRLWFPWRHPATQAPVLGGETRWLRLSLRHASGTGELTWRLRGAW